MECVNNNMTMWLWMVLKRPQINIWAILDDTQLTNQFLQEIPIMNCPSWQKVALVLAYHVSCVCLSPPSLVLRAMALGESHIVSYSHIIFTPCLHIYIYIYGTHIDQYSIQDGYDTPIPVISISQYCRIMMNTDKNSSWKSHDSLFTKKHKWGITSS